MRRRWVPLAVVAAAAIALVLAEVLSGKSDTTSARAAPPLPSEVVSRTLRCSADALPRNPAIPSKRSASRDLRLPKNCTF